MAYNQILFTPTRMQCILDQLVAVIERAGKEGKQTVLSSLPLLTPLQATLLPNPTADLHWSEWRGAINDVFAANAKSAFPNHAQPSPNLPASRLSHLPLSVVRCPCRRFPSRVCIVEHKDEGHGTGDADDDLPSSTSDSPGLTTRTFSYQQIHEASNLVAHYLLKQGVMREDVVTIYAHRGVDLVVAIMGVLKAGATFSVIDPAYPPNRQAIYLQVAQPKGLIVLSKAGLLPPSVRDYVGAGAEAGVRDPVARAQRRRVPGGRHAIRRQH